MPVWIQLLVWKAFSFQAFSPPSKLFYLLQLPSPLHFFKQSYLKSIMASDWSKGMFDCMATPTTCMFRNDLLLYQIYKYILTPWHPDKWGIYDFSLPIFSSRSLWLVLQLLYDLWDGWRPRREWPPVGSTFKIFIYFTLDGNGKCIRVYHPQGMIYLDPVPGVASMCRIIWPL